MKEFLERWASSSGSEDGRKERGKGRVIGREEKGKKGRSDTSHYLVREGEGEGEERAAPKTTSRN